MLRILAIGVVYVMLGSCSTLDPAGTLPTATSVDLSRYNGMWYEIARLPMWGQRNCLRSTAEYRLLESGKVAVRNACTT
ncbi:MAG: lipocalin family protein, partial [Nitrospira sp.]|nr:lipocalin family protein [Nitrospira sp.]